MSAALVSAGRGFPPQVRCDYFHRVEASAIAAHILEASAALAGGEAELPANRGSLAGPVETLSLDFG